jgi:3-oxoacyl-[acyl-carrier protein] reductase
VIAFSKALAKELAPRNIVVNCIAPGYIRSAMTEVLSEAQKESILSQIPLGRMGEVENIAEAVIFLAKAKYITGHVLTVDGGMTMY